MIPFTATQGLSSAFNNFLRAPIDEGSNGMPLSVLSALARLGIDPWQEAATLSALPREKATQRLASLIAGLPDSASIDRSPETIAAPLIALLPRSVRTPAPGQEIPQDARTEIRSRNIAVVILVLLIVAAVTASLFVPNTEHSPRAAKGPVVPVTTQAMPAPEAKPNP